MFWCTTVDLADVMTHRVCAQVLVDGRGSDGHEGWSQRPTCYMAPRRLHLRSRFPKSTFGHNCNWNVLSVST
eukprot:3395384-Amphidinium_carterae.1